MSEFFTILPITRTVDFGGGVDIPSRSAPVSR